MPPITGRLDVPGPDDEIQEKAKIPGKIQQEKGAMVLFCSRCNDRPTGFHGGHELRRHIERCHRRVSKPSKELSSVDFMSQQFDAPFSPTKASASEHVLLDEKKRQAAPPDSDSNYRSVLRRLVRMKKEMKKDSLRAKDVLAPTKPTSYLIGEILNEFVSIVGDALIDKAGACTWARSSLARLFSESGLGRLDKCMTTYIDQLMCSRRRRREQAEEHHTPFELIEMCDQVYRHAIHVIDRCRLEVNFYFRRQVLLFQSSSIPQLSDIQISRARVEDCVKQVEGFHQDSINRSALCASSEKVFVRLDALNDRHESEMYESLAPLTEIVIFILQDRVFQDFAASIRQSYCYDDHGIMDRTKNILLAEVSRQSFPRSGDTRALKNQQSFDNPRVYYSASFEIYWALRTFLHSQFGTQKIDIGSLVVLVGSASYAQCTTCSRYLKSTWPGSGLFFLSVVQQALDTERGKSGEIYEDFEEFGRTLHLAVHSPDSSDDEALGSPWMVEARGTKEMLVNLLQQITWFGAALCSSPYDQKLAYCVAEIESSKYSDPGGYPLCFEVSFHFQPLHSSEKACWLPLFCGAAIARDFPVPSRGDEIGLESSLEILTRIVGASHAVEFEGSLVIKGFSAMLIAIDMDGDKSQWHLVFSKDGQNRLSYQDGLDQCQKRASVNQIDLKCLQNTRAIVGWCTPAHSLVGSDMARYDVEYSAARDANTPLRCTGFTLGFQQFGVGHLDLVLGPKDGICHFQRTGSYNRVVSAADKTFVVLYDTMDKRGWLTRASNVVLHIMHALNRLEPFKVNGLAIDLPTLTPSNASAKEVLLQSDDISPRKGDDCTFKELILRYWSLIELLNDQNARSNSLPGKVVTGRLQEVIRGYEFKAVVQERSPFRRKMSPIRRTNGGWPTFIQDINALVLFGKGFGDLIIPQNECNDNDSSLCRFWNRVPIWEDYLAAEVNILIECYDVAGCSGNQEFLTSTKLQWHQGNSSLFEPCRRSRTHECRCNRLQQIVSKSALTHINPPATLSDAGAVIFGQSRSFKDRILSIFLQMANKPEMYNFPNATIMSPKTNRLGRKQSSDYEPQGDQGDASGSDIITPRVPLKTRPTKFHLRNAVTKACLDSVNVLLTMKRTRFIDSAIHSQALSSGETATPAPKLCSDKGKARVQDLALYVEEHHTFSTSLEGGSVDLPSCSRDGSSETNFLSTPAENASN